MKRYWLGILLLINTGCDPAKGGSVVERSREVAFE